MSQYQLMCNDAVEATRNLPPNSVHLTVFSPPYDNLRGYGGNSGIDLNALGVALFSATADGGVCAMIIQDQSVDGVRSGTTFRTITHWIDEVGWNLMECCIYHRHGRPGQYRNRFRCDHEYIVLFFKGKALRHFDSEAVKIPALHAGKVVRVRTRDYDGSIEPETKWFQSSMKDRGTVWFYNTDSQHNASKAEHPATFPDQLAEDIIKCFSAPGDVVFDPTMGSGTTGVIALRMERLFAGCDIAPEYVELAKKRIAQEGPNVRASEFFDIEVQNIKI